jgi:hypothetical protein
MKEPFPTLIILLPVGATMLALWARAILKAPVNGPMDRYAFAAIAILFWGVATTLNGVCFFLELVSVSGVSEIRTEAYRRSLSDTVSAATFSVIFGFLAALLWVKSRARVKDSD